MGENAMAALRFVVDFVSLVLQVLTMRSPRTRRRVKRVRSGFRVTRRSINLGVVKTETIEVTHIEDRR